MSQFLLKFASVSPPPQIVSIVKRQGSVKNPKFLNVSPSRTLLSQMSLIAYYFFFFLQNKYSPEVNIGHGLLIQ